MKPLAGQKDGESIFGQGFGMETVLIKFLGNY